MVMYEILDGLTEQDIKAICRFANVEWFLNIFEKDKKKYHIYAKNLSNFKVNNLTKKLCPSYAFTLYTKGDEKFKAVIGKAAETRRDAFTKYIENMGTGLLVENIEKFDDSQIVDVFGYILSENNKYTTEEFFLDLKLLGVELNEGRSSLINILIEYLIKDIQTKEQHQKELDEVRRKTEKEVAQRLAGDLVSLKRKYESAKKAGKEAKDKASELEEKLIQYEKKDTAAKEKLIAGWREEFEKLLSIERSNRIEKLLEEIATLRATELSSMQREISEKRGQLESEFMTSKVEYDRLLATLVDEIDKLTAKRNDLSASIEEAERTIVCKNDLLQELNETERKFFENIKTNAVGYQLEEYVFGRRTNQSDVVPKLSIGAATKPLTYFLKSFANSTDEVADAQEFMDIVQDLSDNISLNFEDYGEIAAILISAYVTSKPIIADKCIIGYLAESISAIVDATTPLVINCDGAGMQEIIDEICAHDEKVMVLDGVLETFNEQLFHTICRMIKDKFLFFGVSNFSDVSLYSDSVRNSAIVLDAEMSLTMPRTDPIYIAKHEITISEDLLSAKNCRERYDKHLRALVSEKMLSTIVARDLARFLCVYMNIMPEIGVVLQRSIGYYLCKNGMETDITEKLLEKTGWK